MSGRKNRNRQRRPVQGASRGQSTELLDELNSLRDLLGSDDLGDIPLLDQVAEPAPGGSATPGRPPQPPRPAKQEPLDESDLPILFSPVDEELPEDYKPELNESDRALLRPLQNLPAEPASAGEPEQQGELFGEAETAPAPPENPFLPAHIRARLTGGRMPKPEPETEAAPDREEPHTPPEIAEAPEAEAAAAADTEETTATATHAEAAAPSPPEPEPEPDGEDRAASEREQQRQQLIDHLVARQLPELERQLRARIERMVDELEARDR